MKFNNQLLFGNEWIKSDQRYFKFSLKEDGIYRLSYKDMNTLGIPLSQISANHFKLFHLGKEVAMVASTNDLMTDNDYFIFSGKKNRGELDKPLFKNQNDPLNPFYSMYTDESVYYLTWDNSTTGLRFSKLTNDLSSTVPKDDYFIAKELQLFTNHSNKRSHGGDEQRFPDYDDGQGYGSDFFGNGVGNEMSVDLNFKHIYQDNLEVNISTWIAGRGEIATSHKSAFYLDGNQIGFDLFAGFKTRVYTNTLIASTLNEKMNFTVKAQAHSDDAITLSAIEYTYPKQFIFDQANYSQLILAGSPIRRYFELEDFDGGDQIYVYDETTSSYLLANKDIDGKYKFVLPANNDDRTVDVLNPSEIKSPILAAEVKFKTFESADVNYMILSNKKLYDDGNGHDYVKDYVDYRSSANGGSYKVQLVEVQDLYDQFGYGVHGNPIALVNFFQYCRTAYPNLKFVLLCGKGIQYLHYRTDAAAENEFLFVPTYGVPGADGMLVSDSLRVPFYSIGRVPCLNGTELSNYLNKVKGHESALKNAPYNLDSREWTKKVIHMAGGDPLIYDEIAAQLKTMEETIKNNQFGGNVSTFFKENSQVQTGNVAALTDAVNKGASIISFMGHSAVFKLDFNVENVRSYTNKDKYHLFIAMGCFAGAMFENVKSISEDYNLTPDRGSIVYLSNSTSGLSTILGVYGSNLYGNFGGKYFGKSIGEAVLETNRNTILNSSDEAVLSQALSISYDGDPAIHFLNNTNPDYTIDASTAITEPKTIYATQTNFKFSFDILNLGVSRKDSLGILIEQELPNGQRKTLVNSKVIAPENRKSFSFQIPTNGIYGTGYNKLFVSLDTDNKIAELPNPEAEQNNELIINGNKGFSYYVVSNDPQPVFPQEFAIINTDKPSLVATNPNTLATNVEYIFQLDTTEYFNSPLMVSHTQTQAGGIVSWDTGLHLIDGKVYYWRVATTGLPNSLDAWRNSSFIYLPSSSEGWNQSHFFQLKKDNLTDLKIEEPNRNFSYGNGEIELRAANGYIELPQYYRPRVYSAGDPIMDYKYWEPYRTFSGIIVSVFDHKKGELKINVTGTDNNSVGDAQSAGKPYFIFQTDNKTNRQALISFLKSIASEDVVMLMGLHQFNYPAYENEWENDGPENIYSVLNSYGATEINKLKTFGMLPFIVIYRKDRPDFVVKESLGNKFAENEILFQFNINKSAGSLASTIIGPAKTWHNFLWNFDNFNPNEDTQAINIYGIDANNVEKLLIGPFSNPQQDLSGIDAKAYPNLRLEWKTEDHLQRSTPNLDYWRVIYQGLPDIAFNPTILFKKNKDTLNQGDTFKVQIMSQNISNYGMDSVLVRYTIVDKRNFTSVSQIRYAAVGPKGTLIIPYQIVTKRQNGNYRLYIELNPNKDQAESNTSNNTAVINYYVRPDKRRPFLDVLIGGLHIPDGGYVIPNPKIQISLIDENKDQALDDTSLFEIHIANPDSPIDDLGDQVYFTQQNVTFVKSTLGTGNPLNEARVYIDGEFDKEGLYTLQIRAKDASGNEATDLYYLSSFYVKLNKNTGHLSNIPNPLNQFTYFQYTLEGTELPSSYFIQIMNTSGKIVRTISQAEIGPIQLGTHLFEYAYDGTDDEGNALENGVYVYRIITSDPNGKSTSKNKKYKDGFFGNDFGKMLIVR